MNTEEAFVTQDTNESWQDLLCEELITIASPTALISSPFSTIKVEHHEYDDFNFAQQNQTTTTTTSLVEHQLQHVPEEANHVKLLQCAKHEMENNYQYPMNLFSCCVDLESPKQCGKQKNKKNPAHVIMASNQFLMATFHGNFQAIATQQQQHYSLSIKLGFQQRLTLHGCASQIGVQFVSESSKQVVHEFVTTMVQNVAFVCFKLPDEEKLKNEKVTIQFWNQDNTLLGSLIGVELLSEYKYNTRKRVLSGDIPERPAKRMKRE